MRHIRKAHPDVDPNQYRQRTESVKHHQNRVKKEGGKVYNIHILIIQHTRLVFSLLG